MNIFSAAHDIEFHHPPQHPFDSDPRRRKQRDALAGELLASLAREQALLRDKRDLSRHQVTTAQEFEHRLMNGLQLIASLLSSQSRTASTPEAADQLKIAAGRVVALGRVHHRLHVADHEDIVEIKQYLHHLCEDLSGLLFQEVTSHAIAVEGAAIEIPTAFAIPLGFIVNELITNSAKYGDGNIKVRLETNSPGNHSLSVLDEGPGLPAGFDPAHRKGLGMKIVLGLVDQIGGTMHVGPGDHGRGSRFTVTFCSPTSAQSPLPAANGA
jgi:two-component sensor histidine kinase